METVLYKNAYCIKKSSISEKDLKKLKKKLKVTPLNSFDTGMIFMDNSFPIYHETTSKIYIPKYYSNE